MDSEYIVEGWKGKDEIDFDLHLDGDVTLIEHRKNKETGEVIETRHEVKHEHIQFLWDLIKTLPKDIEFKSPYFWRKIIDTKGLGIDINAFNGGKNRALYYFPLFYHPIKILEAGGLIHYGGRGTIMMITR